MATSYCAAVKALFVMLVVTGGLLILSGCENPQREAREAGLAAYKAGDYPAALAKFDEALTHDQFSPEDNYYAGNAALELGKLQTAEYHYKLSWQADPSVPEVKMGLTEALLRQGKTDQALDFLERDSKIMEGIKDPRGARMWGKQRYVWEVEERMFLGKAGSRANVARVYERIGDMDNARVYYEEARKMAPWDTQILVAVGEFYGRVGDKRAAQDALTEAYHRDPKTPGLVDAMTRNGIYLNDVIK